MRRVHLGSLAVGEIPRVAGVVCSAETLRSLEGGERPPCDIIEVRLDELWPIGDWWKASCSSLKKAGVPVILTIRAKNEGGRWQGTYRERAAIFLDALDAVSAIDLELRNGIPPDIREQAGLRGVGLIISYHDFERTPSLRELAERIRKAREEGAAVAKIATMVKTEGDIETLTELTAETREAGPVCVIGMGPLGASTRLSLPAAGSALSYGYLDKPSAPGQLSCAELSRRLRELKEAH